MSSEPNLDGKSISQQSRKSWRSLYYSNAKKSIASKADGLRRWFLHSASPYLYAISEKAIHGLTRQKGDKEWTALTPSNRWSRYTIWTLVGVAGFGIVWALLARIDETVQAVGKLEPLGTTIDIKAPLGGVIRGILVKDGDFVKKNQVLVEMDTTAAKARLDALISVKQRTEVDLLLSKSQLGIDIDGSTLSPNQTLRLESLRDEFRSRISASQNNIERSQEQFNSTKYQYESKSKALAIRERILKDIEPLANQGGISRSQYLKELQDVELLRGEVKSLKANLVAARAGISEAINKLKNTKSLSQIDFSTKVEETQKQIAQLETQISEAEVTLKYQALRAPKDGIVFDLQASSAGYVANNERPILKIVPTDNLVARVFIPNKDIGFIKVGQPSKVRVDAFPYNEFGEISGSIKSIGSDVLEPDEQFKYYRFPVTVNLNSNSLEYKGSKLMLMAGMSVSANIILRQRPVIAIFTQKLLPFWDSLETL